ncbi:TPA: DUF624 domain-containing protein [Enterococcus faecium]|nr:DUF624 domain-containing protein [Enterococcus faecium]HAY6958213.1 DUF624 domain-containing protein [Enterococcus faecium]
MNENKWTKGFNWVFQLLLLNFTYFILICLGFGILGFFPATIALIAGVVNRKKYGLQESVKFMSKIYKKNFVRYNLYCWSATLLLAGNITTIWLCWQQSALLFYLLSTLLSVITLFLVFAMLNWVVIKSLGLWMMGDRLIDYLLFTATMLPTVVMQGLVLGIYFRILMILPVIFLFGGTAVTVILISKLTERALAKLPCQIQSH